MSKNVINKIISKGGSINKVLDTYTSTISSTSKITDIETLQDADKKYTRKIEKEKLEKGDKGMGKTSR